MSNVTFWMTSDGELEAEITTLWLVDGTLEDVWGQTYAWDIENEEQAREFCSREGYIYKGEME